MSYLASQNAFKIKDKIVALLATVRNKTMKWAPALTLRQSTLLATSANFQSEVGIIYSFASSQKM